MATARVGGLRADITARDTGFQAAVGRTVRSLNRVQTTSARVNRSFASQASAATRATRSFNLVAAGQQAVARASRAMTAVMNLNITAIKASVVNMFRYISNLNFARLSTIALNATTAILSGNLLQAGRTAAAFLGPQAALAAAAIGTGAALRRIGDNADIAATGIDRMSTATSRMNALFNRIGTITFFAVLAASVGRLVRGFTDTVDSITNLTNRINLFAQAGQDAEATLDSLRSIAEGTRTSLRSTGEVYTRLAEALTDRFDVSQLLTITDSIQRTVVLSGVSAQSAEAALVQLGQGLASGVLRGEELNSVMEQLPRAARALSDELGVTIGELREMAKQGLLTSEVVAEAFFNQASVIQDEFASQTETVDQALTVAGDKFDEMLVAIDNAFGVSEKIIGLINTAGDVFKDIAGFFDDIAELWADIRNAIENVRVRGIRTVLDEGLLEGSAIQVAKIREEMERLGPRVSAFALDQSDLNEEFTRASDVLTVLSNKLINLERSGYSRIPGFDLVIGANLKDRIEEAREEVDRLRASLEQGGADTVRFAQLADELGRFVEATQKAVEESKQLEEENVNLTKTIDELDDAITVESVEEWRPYSDAIEEAAQAVRRFSEQYRAALEHNERVRMNIEQLDASLDDETHLRVIQELLDNNAQIAEFFKEEVVETVDEYARWIAEQQRLNAEFQKAIDLEVAGVGEDIAGRIFFGINQQIEPVIQHIDQLDDALTNKPVGDVCGCSQGGASCCCCLPWRRGVKPQLPPQRSREPGDRPA